LCLQLLTWLRKCCNTFRFCRGLSHELLLIATTTSSADLSRFLKAV
jgi:hypothetical protein